MNAQEEWKSLYRTAQAAKHQGDMVSLFELLAEAMDYRREAALERRVERLERENARLKKSLNYANYAFWQECM